MYSQQPQRVASLPGAKSLFFFLKKKKKLLEEALINENSSSLGYKRPEEFHALTRAVTLFIRIDILYANMNKQAVDCSSSLPKQLSINTAKSLITMFIKHTCIQDFQICLLLSLNKRWI